MEKILRYITVLVPISLFYAIVFMLEKTLAVDSFYIKLVQYTAIPVTIAVAMGVFDTYIFHFVISEETKKSLIRLGIGAVVFFFAFCIIALLGR